MEQPSRPPYNGLSRKLVVAFDVGTTFSGISYCLLDPGIVPEIKGVMKFPDQELISSDSKVPSIVWYGPEGDVRAIGASAIVDGILERAEEEQLTKVEWFKLHMRPKSLGQDEVENHMSDFPPLPPNKSVISIFADFLKYLHGCTKTYIEERHTSGEALFASLRSTTEFVLSHPNGWEGPQQSQMRRAAILAGLVPESEADKRIHFVTEGEACLHFCIGKGLTTESMKKGHSVMVIDAGGGTIDISTYKQAGGSKGEKKGSFEEYSIPRCSLNGSVFVTARARSFLNEFLSDSAFNLEANHIAELFDRTAKHRFRTDQDPSFIRFGFVKHNDAKKGIRSGQLKLDGKVVATFFQPSVDAIIEAILEHRWDSNVRTAFMVGGFAANDWLFNKVKEAVEDYEIDLCRPDNLINKAVADGAVSYFIDHYVTSRRSRYCYGTLCDRAMINSDPEHMARTKVSYTGSDGNTFIPNAFVAILPKNTQVSETQEYRRTFVYNRPNLASISTVSDKILRYSGSKGNSGPRWQDEDPNNFELACNITVDTSKTVSSLKPVKNKKTGKTYYRQEIDFILLFGQTELRAQLAWREDGVEKRGPAMVIYETD